MRLALMLILLSGFAQGEALKNLITLDSDSEVVFQDDYIQLQLINPSYSTMAKINSAVTVWLGPNMTILRNSEAILIQAPRDRSRRVEFIAALLALEIE